LHCLVYGLYCLIATITAGKGSSEVHDNLSIETFQNRSQSPVKRGLMKGEI